MKTIKKTIDINAPKDKVYDVLMQDKYTRIWYGEFKEGSHAETDWKVGSKARFTDNEGGGMVARIIENKPSEKISIEYEGVIANGIEDYDSAEAKKWKGGHETYKLSGDGTTHLSIESEMAPEFYDIMSESWDKGLKKIKELSETK